MRLLRGFFATLLSLGLILPSTTLAQSNTRNCDSNAMIYCGAYSKDELIRKMTQGDGQNSSPNIRGLFPNINPADVRSSSTVNGEVHKDGSVQVQGKKVATDAYSYGRQNMPGSTKEGSLYKRPTSVSFSATSLPAYVNMKDGKFQWAIIKSCGNLVTATPVAPPAKKVAKITNQTIVQQTVVQQVVQQTPAPAPKPLPQTGAEAIALPGLIGLASISSGLGLYVRGRHNLLKRLANSA